MRFWNFIVNEANPEEVELRIEGNIVDDESAWLYEWFGIQAASPNAFRTELSQYAGKNITVWINSYGGSVFAAAGIYTALMEHKKSGAKVTTKIDSKAMSAATVPFMAGDERLMSPPAIFMMHNPLLEVYGYASELRKAADVLDIVKETIISAYQLGSGRSAAKISALMDDETYMSAKTAVKEGFATGMLYTDTNIQSVENSFMFSHAAIQNSFSATARSIIDQLSELGIASASGAGLNIPKKQEPALKPQPVNQNEEDEGTVEIKTVDEMRQHFPDLCNQLDAAAREEGAKNERQRINAIDQISKTLAPELVAKAKYEEPMTAEQLAFEAIKADASKGRQHMNDLEADNAASGTQKVTGNPQTQQTEKEKEEAERNSATDYIAQCANQRRGVKKES